ncbi:uncharacterized protein LOC117509911 [Thalassophryne amazonica]|uniref:uncharacterized protein LOC117509911 n=1 Tax=Thalassophryne amazonica TaxID=390379 RepID=UPI001471CFA3|nr:uncharacterized protein LOC117509911 [Thalassophryne amazonica]
MGGDSVQNEEMDQGDDEDWHDNGVDSGGDDEDDDFQHGDGEEGNEPDDNYQGFSLEDGNLPIYPDAPITKSQSLLLIVSYVLRDGLSDSALDDLLSLMNIHCPNSVPTSKYLLYKSVEDSMYEVHYYCMACTAYLGPEKLTRNCKNCGNEFSADISTAEGSFFLRMPVKTQLQRMMKVPEVAAALENRNIDEILRETNINYIVHGKLYKNLLHDGIIGPSDLSLLFNTDGVSIFKSSNFSVWPLFATINEISPHMHRKHMIMAGLWFGECKPNMNTFLKPFVDELRDLGADGLHSPLGQTRIFALCITRRPSFVDARLGCSSDFLVNIDQQADNPNICIYPGDILQKCIFMKTDVSSYLCPLPSRFYWD